MVLIWYWNLALNCTVTLQFICIRCRGEQNERSPMPFTHRLNPWEFILLILATKHLGGRLRGSGITTARPPALWQGPCSWAALVSALWRRRAAVFIKCKTELRAFNNCLSLLKLIYLLLFSPQGARSNRGAGGYRARPRRGCAGGGAGPVPPARSHPALRWRRPGREALAAEGARR